MGSVGFDGEDESQPSTSNGKKYKLPRKLLDDCGAVSHASVPRKLRSAIKKRGRESIAPPLPISRKQHHVSDGVKIPRKYCTKKSKLNKNITKDEEEVAISMKQHQVSDGIKVLRKYSTKKSKSNKKQEHITKDEEEVAETLYALADMFSDASKANPPVLDDEPPETKSSTILETQSLMNAMKDTGLTLREESRKISSKVTLETAHSSNLMDSTAQAVKFQYLCDAQQPEFPFGKQPAIPRASGVQSDLSLGPRPMASTLDKIPDGERAIALEQVTASGIQYGKHYYPMEDKNNGLFRPPSLSATGALSSETQESFLRLPAWFESTNCATQPRVKENTAEKYPEVVVKSKKSWKRCSAHVYISRLIKVLQLSERKEGPLEKPNELSSCGVADLRSHVSTHNQTMGINGSVCFNGIPQSDAEKKSAEFQNDILLHKRPLQDQQLASETSALCSSIKQGYNFLSLGTGVCGLDASDGINSAGHSHEASSKQFHVSYLQPQNKSAILFSLPQTGYSSTFHGHTSALAAQQVQLPRYHGSTVNSSFTAQTGQQLESQQQKWTTQLMNQYNAGGVGTPHLPDWKNGGRDSPSMLNYAQALFPHLHATLGSKYQQFSPPQQQLMAINSSLPLSNLKRYHHHLPSGFERNGAAFDPESIPQLQLLCNQHL